MSTVIMNNVVSLDGFIADLHDDPGPLFDWYFNGDTELTARPSGWTFRVSQTSHDYIQPFWDEIKVTVIGRHLFDTTNGWDGKPAAGDELVVVTHRVGAENPVMSRDLHVLVEKAAEPVSS